MKWHLQSVRELGIKDGSHVLLTLSTLEEISEALPSPLRVKKCRSAVQTTFRKQQTIQLMKV